LSERTFARLMSEKEISQGVKKILDRIQVHHKE
jgi:hypothetical protein